MTPYTNPYAPPQNADLYGVSAPTTSDAGVVPDGIVEKLRGTRPWVLFLAILGLLFSGLAVLGGFGVMAMSAVAPSTSKGMPLMLAGVLYVVLGGVYVMPAVGLLRYASAIADLVRDPRMERLGTALENQRWFWKVVGIIAAVILAMYPVIIIGAIIAVATKVIH